MHTIFWLWVALVIIVDFMILLSYSSWHSTIESLDSNSEKFKKNEMEPEERKTFITHICFIIILCLICIPVNFFGLLTNQWLGFLALLILSLISVLLGKILSGTAKKVKGFTIHLITLITYIFLLINEFHLKIDFVKIILGE